MEEPKPEPVHYELKAEPLIFNQVPMLGDEPQEGEVNGERQ